VWGNEKAKMKERQKKKPQPDRTNGITRNYSLWGSPRFATFYDADVATRLAPFARIVIFWKVTFHLLEASRIRASKSVKVGDR
jgi:hypothetical protein